MLMYHTSRDTEQMVPALQVARALMSACNMLL
jgi:hypothetical protein